MTAAERESLESAARVAASLDQPAAVDSTTSLGDLVAPDGTAWTEDVEEQLVFDKVRGAIDRLPEPPARRAPDALRLRRRLPGLPAGHRGAPRAWASAGSAGPRRRASPPCCATGTWSARTRPPERHASGERRQLPDQRRERRARAVHGRASTTGARRPDARTTSSKAWRKNRPAGRSTGRVPPAARSGRRPPPDGRSPPCARGPGGSARSRATRPRG